MAENCCPIPPKVWSEPDLRAVPLLLAWPVDLTCCPAFNGLDAQAKLTLGSRVKAAAIDYMWRLTNQRFGVCCRTIRPQTGCECVIPCTCRVWTRLRLDIPGDFTATGVWWGSATGKQFYDPCDWRVDSPYWLTPSGQLLLDGFPPQNMNLRDGEIGTWGVDGLVGDEPSPIVLEAANAVACELLAFCTDQPCDVPANAVSVSRDGVSIQLSGAFDGLRVVAAVKALDWSVTLPPRILDMTRMREHSYR